MILTVKVSRNFEITYQSGFQNTQLLRLFSWWCEQGDQTLNWDGSQDGACCLCTPDHTQVLELTCRVTWPASSSYTAIRCTARGSRHEAPCPKLCTDEKNYREKHWRQVSHDRIVVLSPLQSPPLSTQTFTEQQGPANLSVFPISLSLLCVCERALLCHPNKYFTYEVAIASCICESFFYINILSRLITHSYIHFSIHPLPKSQMSQKGQCAHFIAPCCLQQTTLGCSDVTNGFSEGGDGWYD